MADTRTPISETFAVEQGSLVRRVVPKRGKPYEHRCTLATFTEVAHRIDEAGEHGTNPRMKARAGVATAGTSSPSTGAMRHPPPVHR